MLYILGLIFSASSKEMAPKKKSQNQRNKSTSKNVKSQSSSAPTLQISAENENRLRRLLLNSGRPAHAAANSSAHDTLSMAQKAKKLKGVYEKLSCEGFSNEQIELALSSLKEGATFEVALDWLCLNLRSKDLPLKFSSGTSLHPGGSVGVISTAQDNWVPSVNPSIERNKDEHDISVRVKQKKDESSLDACQPAQADWIRQYMQNLEEDESSWEDETIDKEVARPRSLEVIAEEYNAARSEAAKAKDEGNKESQAQAGNTIRKLKQELSILGLSDEILASQYSDGHATATDISPDNICTSLKPSDHQTAIPPDDEESDLALDFNEQIIEGNNLDSSSPGEPISKPLSSALPAQKDITLDDVSDDVELGDIFSEDAPSNEACITEALELQKKEKLKKLYSEESLKKLDGIWKKGDLQKIPKAVLHQLCQRSGWEAPKFNKVQGKEYSFFYSVSVLRKASGRGKSRKAGGLITLQLPNQDETFSSAEDAQNRVAAFALHHLFPDLPIHLVILEPYASLVLQWKEDELPTTIDDTEEERRAGFVERLLNADDFNSITSATSRLTYVPEAIEKSCAEEIKHLAVINADQRAERNFTIEAESSFLRREMENKNRDHIYKDMLKFRTGLPIAGLKGDILQLLKDNTVLVVCGETGSGKTTQVPQFILDDMIESGNGGYCNIICTQPRRIAAISVATRVADERCEPIPGANGSLVGYQVRLDSARNEKTKLLFCTTGILLRKLMGDKDLIGITHVIVDEVHERSLLGDFLLIILKNLVEKQSALGRPKLKVILMSATVDSNLFSSYFGHCPVITAQGRTHPVTTYFLEDIYESVNYRLASDSPASLRSEAFTKDMRGPVNNHRGKKNLVMSAWGDDSVLSEEKVNPFYVSSHYTSYSNETQKNLRRLNEDVIDYDLLEDLVCHVDETCEDGAILIFLPGVSEIYMLLDRLAASYRFGGASSEWILPLHSSIASTDQKKVFLRPPENIRKVIIATNIAETSITIDDVVYVIDCGKHKENRYNPQKKLSSMVEDWISRANARQRRGRAGRVKPGTCFCLYTRYRFEKIMRPYQVPEMLRMPLVELCLQIKLLGLGDIKQFLSKALEPPRQEAMSSAISLLYEVGAIEGDEDLTPLGHHLAKLPVDLLIGKMLLYGGIFGCLSPILSIAAYLSYKSPFLYPKDEMETVERAKLALLTGKLGCLSDSNDAQKYSDHLMVMIAYKRWEVILREKGVKAAQQFCNAYFLSSSVMYMIRDMRVQFGTLLADNGLLNLQKKYQNERAKEYLDGWFSDYSQPFNMHSHQPEIVKAILCAGLYPNIAATEQGISEAVLISLQKSTGPARKDHPVWYDGRREVYIHNSSINRNLKAFQYPFLVFLEKVETNRVFLRDTTIVSPFSILLFGGSISIQHQTGLVTIDGWLKLKAAAQTAVLFKELRSSLHSILKELIRKPENATVVDNEVFKSMIKLLLDEGKPQI